MIATGPSPQTHILACLCLCFPLSANSSRADSWAVLLVSFPLDGPWGFPGVLLIGKLRPRDSWDLGLSQGKTQWFARQETNSTAHRNVPPPSEVPRARPHPMVGTGRPGQLRAGDTHLGVNQEHLASTAGSDVASAGARGQPVGRPYGRVQSQTPAADPSRPGQRWGPSLPSSSPTQNCLLPSH